MNANTLLLSIIFCFQTVLCGLPDHLSALCKDGAPDKVIRMLRSSSTDTSDLERQAQLCFNEAVAAENYPVIKVLPQHYPNVSKNGQALLEACAHGRAEMVKVLLGLPGINPAADQNAALLAASRGNYQDIVDILLQESAVLDALEPKHLNIILGHQSSSDAKLILLSWMAYNKYFPVDMTWIPEYKFILRFRPQSAAQIQVIKDRAVAELRDIGLDRIAKFINSWAGFFTEWVPKILESAKTFKENADRIDLFMSHALPRKF